MPSGQRAANSIGAIAPVMRFENIKIAPFTELLSKKQGLAFHKGGPIWPDWDTRSLVRHRWGTGPVDTRPDDFPDEAIVETLHELAVWCGPVSKHFGHCIADFSTRIPVYAQLNPLPLFVFGCPPNTRYQTVAETPAYFQQLLQWYGVPSARVKLVSQPTLATSLLCVGQQERLRQRGPGEHYLALLLNNAQRNGLHPVERRGVVFVSRAGMPSKLAGESYLEAYCQQLGVQVIRPETLPVHAQLAAYAGAHTLLFSEGSALHALQLLGKQLGHVHVLRRRPNTKVAAASLQPRTESLAYHNVGELICGLHRNGSPAGANGLTWLSPDKLLAALDQAGLPRGAWDQAAFEASAQADLADWWASEHRPGTRRAANSDEHIAQRLSSLGLQPPGPAAFTTPAA